MDSDQPLVEVVHGENPGPIVAILGGVHGDEYEGVLAARTLLAILELELESGSVRISAPAHPAAWRTSTRESSTDGKNLARVFPGCANGSPTEKVAHFLTQNLIRGADLLIDLHSAGSSFDMPLLCGYHDSNDGIAVRSRLFAEKFSAPFLWRHDGSPLEGRSISAAYNLGVPGIYVESQGGLGVRSKDLDCYIDGVRRILHHLGMIKSSIKPIYDALLIHGHGNTDAGLESPCNGYIISHVTAGDVVQKGELISTIINIDGATCAEIRAENLGVVMLMRRIANVAVGETVCILGTPQY